MGAQDFNRVTPRQMELYDFSLKTKKSKDKASATKEAAECALFTCFAHRDAHIFLETTPLHYILFPLLAIGITMDATLEVYEYIHKEKNIWNTIQVIAAVIGAIIVDTVVIAGIVLGTFTLGPYLFLGALGCMATRSIAGLIENTKKYHEPSNAQFQQKHREAAIRNAIHLIGIALVTTLVVGVLISPIGPAFALALGTAATLFTLSLLIWRVAVPYETKKRVKNKMVSFFSEKSSRIKKIAEPPSLNPSSTLK